jgi:hypothetical protein
MKWCMKLILTGLIASLGGGMVGARAEVAFSAGITIHAKADFYEPLTPYGAWVDVGRYGRCWHPARVEAGWRPYCDGHWEWTDLGWYWVSDEPWAWACYHYGRWVDDPNYGWVWTPDLEWAPAWVYWREGGDYIGWAPCPPTGIAIVPSWFVFVDVHRFHERIRPSTVIVNNTTIINRTRLITDVRRETRTIGGAPQRVVINEGPGVDPIQKATGRKFTPIPIHEAVRHTPAPSTLRQSVPEPTGRERAPSAQEQPKSPPQREQVAPAPGPQPQPAPVVPPQTGRERGRVYEQPEPKAPPRERVAPTPQRPPVTPPPESEKGKRKDKENP